LRHRRIRGDIEAGKRKAIHDPKTDPGFPSYPAWDGNQPLIDCTPMRARISERACGLNKETCKTAIIQTLEGLSPFSLKREELDRLFWCGRCPRFLRWDDISYTRDRQSYNPRALTNEPDEDGECPIQCAEDVIRLVLKGLTKEFLRIEDMDLDRGDEEVGRIRQRDADRRYRRKKKVREALDSWVINTTEE
jgi:hypothetical protein